ncbi:cutinase family protein [Streptomyces vastus]|uniref:PE-PPE domain-containing protein n=1 Tax=Streptomyces vastus TaxID=285451 RepID=A0ABN3RMV5_9ACTN
MAATSPELSAQSSNCRDVYFFGGHGLGEGSETDWGRTVGDVYLKFRDALHGADPDVSVDGAPIAYPRKDLPGGGLLGLGAAWVETWEKEQPDIVDGAAALSSQINRRISQCQHAPERFVIVGFSEGAWVIHQYLKKAPQQILNMISGVALLGDPQYTGTGIIPKRIPKYAITPFFPREIARRATSWCLSYYLPAAKRTVADPICMYGNRKDEQNCRKAANMRLDEAWCPHLWYRQSGNTQRAADYLVSLS